MRDEMASAGQQNGRTVPPSPSASRVSSAAETSEAPSSASSAVKPLRLAIVDNDDFTLAALVSFVPKAVPSCSIAWRTSSPIEAMDKAADPLTAPDILLLDMSLGERYTGPEVCRTIRAQSADVAVLGITSFTLDHYALDLAAAGAQGIVSKADMAQIALGISRLRSGGTFSPLSDVHFESVQIAHERVAYESAARQRQVNAKPQLSVHEARIMEMLSQGFKYSQIAAELGNSESSVRTETHRAVKKLGAATLSQAVVTWVLGQMT